MRKLRIAALVLVAAAAGAQLIRPERGNPPADPRTSFAAVVQPPQRAISILERSCGDCHSNLTVWPWYSKVAPVSWLVASDVSEGRSKLNLSRWDIYSPEMSKIRTRAMCGQARSGEMPPWYYLPMHPGAKLAPGDVAAICALEQ